MFARQFPAAARTMFGATRQNLGREHAVDFEKLKLDRIAAGVGRRVDEGQGTVQVASMVARGFGYEQRSVTHESHSFLF
jgi:hypothetical protein